MDESLQFKKIKKKRLKENRKDGLKALFAQNHIIAMN